MRWGCSRERERWPTGYVAKREVGHRSNADHRAGRAGQRVRRTCGEERSVGHNGGGVFAGREGEGAVSDGGGGGKKSGVG